MSISDAGHRGEKPIEMITKNQFHVLADAARFGARSQRAIAAATGLSVGSTNMAVKAMKSAGMLDGSGSITEAGLAALAPYKVDNAIIMAAGLSARFAPISYEMPKGVLEVKGEVLVERQIKQLKEAGIDDITVVVGYMKEQFFYLENLFGCKIRVNEEYANRNNNSTLMLVKDELKNTYICSSDDYFTENVFEPYVYKAYYSAVFFEGKTEEYCMKTGPNKRITKITVGGENAYGMLGHAYFDREFSKAFVRFLEQDYDLPETAGKLWEDIFSDHVSDLDMVMRVYEPGIISEFDSLSELRAFDPDFINNVDSSILDNICKTLDAVRTDVVSIVPLSQGLTNLSFKFTCKGKTYVYRHPGAGTDEIINRESEAFSQNLARELGLDGTFVYEDPAEGWKISRFIEGSRELDYHNWDEVAQALEMARKLHGCGVESKWTFDVHANTKELIEMLDARHRASFKDFKELFALIDGLNDFVQSDGTPACMCHSDFYSPNFLVTETEMHLIDWEYSGMSDYACDLGTFICCSDYTFDEAVRVINMYFQREPSDAELAHCLAYVAISSYYWFVWALYKDACGAPVGEWLYLWYKNAKLFGSKAREVVDSL